MCVLVKLVNNNNELNMVIFLLTSNPPIMSQSQLASHHFLRLPKMRSGSGWYQWSQVNLAKKEYKLGLARLELVTWQWDIGKYNNKNITWRDVCYEISSQAKSSLSREYVSEEVNCWNLINLIWIITST